VRCIAQNMMKNVVAVTIFAAAVVGGMHGYVDTAGDGYGYGCL
jgi:hypothetical protein